MNANHSKYRDSLAGYILTIPKESRKNVLSEAKKLDIYSKEHEVHLGYVQSFLRNKRASKYKTLLLDAGIIDLIESKGLDFDILTSQSKEFLLEKYGVAYIAVVELLFELIKNKKDTISLKQNIELVKNRINIVMDVFFNNDLTSSVGSHLRQRQKESVIKTLDFISNSPNDTGYIHYPTSGGKTVMFGDIIRNILRYSSNKKIVITVPNIEALNRSKKEFEKIGLDVGLYYGEEKNLTKEITIGTTHSLRIALGQGKIHATTFDLMICDEAHEGYLGEKTTDFIGQFVCKKIGYTATPELRNKSVYELFKEKIDEYLIDEAILNKELPRIDSHIKLQVDDGQFEKLKVSDGEFTKDSLEKFDVSITFPVILQALREGELKGKQMAIFMPSVNTSKELNAYLINNGITSTHIDGETANREEVKDDFESRKTQVLVSCDVLKSSWDSDVIDGVIINRPILSPAVYMQMVGRAMHGKETLHNGIKVPKNEVIVVDIINSNQDILTRHITVDSIRPIIDFSGEKERSCKIKIHGNDNISEILFYYDIKEFFSEDMLQEIYTEFAELYQLTLTDFLQKLKSDIYKLYNENIRLSISLKSNSKFGEAYAGIEREFEIDLLVLQKLVSLYKLNISRLEINQFIEKYTIAGIEYEQSGRGFINKETGEILMVGGYKIRGILRELYFGKNLYLEIVSKKGYKTIIDPKTGDAFNDIEKLGEIVQIGDNTYTTVNFHYGANRLMKMDTGEFLKFEDFTVTGIGEKVNVGIIEYLTIVGTGRSSRLMNPITGEFLKVNNAYVSRLGKVFKICDIDCTEASIDGEYYLLSYPELKNIFECIKDSANIRIVDDSLFEIITENGTCIIVGKNNSRNFGKGIILNSIKGKNKTIYLVENDKYTDIISEDESSRVEMYNIKIGDTLSISERLFIEIITTNGDISLFDVDEFDYLKVGYHTNIAKIGKSFMFGDKKCFEVRDNSRNTYILDSKTLKEVVVSKVSINKVIKSFVFQGNTCYEVLGNRRDTFIIDATNWEVLRIKYLDQTTCISSIGECWKIGDTEYCIVDTEYGKRKVKRLMNTKTGEGLRIDGKLITGVVGIVIMGGIQLLKLNLSTGHIFVNQETGESLQVLDKQDGDKAKQISLIGSEGKLGDTISYITAKIGGVMTILDLETHKPLVIDEEALKEIVREVSLPGDKTYYQIKTSNGVGFLEKESMKWLKIKLPRVIIHKRTLLPIHIDQSGIHNLGKKVELGSDQYICITSRQGKNYLMNTVNKELLVIDGICIKEIGREVSLGDSVYIEAIGDNTYFLDKKTQEPLEINGDYVSELGTEILIGDKRYLQVRCQNSTYIIDHDTGKILEIEGKIVSDLGETVECLGTSYLRLRTIDNRWQLRDKKTQEPLEINGEYASELGEIPIGDKRYLQVRCQNSRYIIDHNTGKILEIEGKIVVDLGETIECFGTSYTRLRTIDNRWYLYDATKKECLKINSHYMSNIIGKKFVGKTELIEMLNENGNSIFVDSERRIITNNNSEILRKVINKNYGYTMLVYDNNSIIVNDDGEKFILSGMNVIDIGGSIGGFRSLRSVIVSSGETYIYNFDNNELVHAGDGGILKSIIRELENGKLLVETTKNKELIVDRKFGSIGLNISNNLDKEPEYKLGGMRIKNAIFSDGTVGLVNAMTLEMVSLMVDNIIITSVDDENNGVFDVQLADGREVQINNYKSIIVLEV